MYRYRILIGLLLCATEKVSTYATSSVKLMQDLEIPDSDKSFYQYVQPFALVHTDTPTRINQDILHQDGRKIYYQPSDEAFRNIEVSPNLGALLFTSWLKTAIRTQGKSSFNHQDHLPVNPYIALLLSHYGKYIPLYGVGKGIYAYTASNNYHNNKPFGSYKIYRDSGT